jgi:hypothetical protein
MQNGFIIQSQSVLGADLLQKAITNWKKNELIAFIYRKYLF